MHLFCTSPLIRAENPLSFFRSALNEGGVFGRNGQIVLRQTHISRSFYYVIRQVGGRGRGVLVLFWKSLTVFPLKIAILDVPKRIFFAPAARFAPQNHNV